MALVAFATVRISQAATIVTAPAGGDWSDPAGLVVTLEAAGERLAR